MLTALVANQAGEIFELDGYAAVGIEGNLMKPLSIRQARRIPYGSELMLLPDRKPILYNLTTRRYEVLFENPHAPGEVIFPVAAFNSPGYLITYISAYQETEQAGSLPLF